MIIITESQLNYLQDTNNYTFETKLYKKPVKNAVGDKIGEHDYLSFEMEDGLDGSCFGAIYDVEAETYGFNDDKFKLKKIPRIANITSIQSDTKNITNKNTKRGFFKKVISILKSNGVKFIEINLQSSDSRKALARLVETGLLKNPSKYTGLSVDLHPKVFEIS